jgi:plastocyanin/methionine-rich copper-binding protein CopC
LTAIKLFISLRNLNITVYFLLLFILVFLVSACSVSDTGIEDEPESEEIEVVTDIDDPEEPLEEISLTFVFETPVKSPHYVDNVPYHASVIPAVPVNVIVNFDFDVIPSSAIVVTGQDGQVYSTGDAIIDDNKLNMRVMMAPDAPEGLYTVNYEACWPDGSCHEGMFQFAIDRSLLSEFEDLKGQSEIVVDMQHNYFEPEDIIISVGTTITWINNDTVDHYINTDPHPGHNYFPVHNSRSIAGGESFSLKFDQPGYYPYHCSAHPATMIATIIVE